MKTVVFANQKGGVAKTANACLLAHYLAHSGERVLVLDFDHQGNLSKPLVKSGKCVAASITADQLFTDGAADVEGGSLVLVPTDPVLLNLERQPDKHNAFAGCWRRPKIDPPVRVVPIEI
jgi:chromosome partitioning protein